MTSMRARWRALSAGVRYAITGRSQIAVRFAGAGVNRLIERWFADLDDLNNTLRYELSTLRGRSRQLVNDNGEAEGLLKDFESDIVGAAGARLQFRARRPRAGMLEALNDRVEWAWDDWTRPANCSIDGQLSFASHQRLMIRTVIVDGEYFARVIRDPKLPFGIALQPLDANQIDENENHPRGTHVGGRVRGTVVLGVELNEWGRPVSYAIWDRDPSDPQRKKIWVDASEIIHVFKRLRPGQVRGVPWFAPALVLWKLGDRATEAELYQSMLAAAQGGFFINRDGSSAVLTEPKRDADGNVIPLEMQAEPGLSRSLPPGWEWQAWEPKHPTANFGEFMRVVKRMIARAFGRSYASLSGDLTAVNFSSMRTDRVREISQNKIHQESILIEQFCAPICAAWFPMAALTGELGAFSLDARTVSRATTWMCTGSPWIDPLKDATTARVELSIGINSPQRICADRGRDYFEVIDEIAEAREYAAERGVTLDNVVDAVTTDVADTDDDAADNRPRHADLSPRLALARGIS